MGKEQGDEEGDEERGRKGTREEAARAVEPNYGQRDDHGDGEGCERRRRGRRGR